MQTCFSFILQWNPIVPCEKKQTDNKAIIIVGHSPVVFSRMRWMRTGYLEIRWVTNKMHSWTPWQRSKGPRLTRCPDTETMKRDFRSFKGRLFLPIWLLQNIENVSFWAQWHCYYDLLIFLVITVPYVSLPACNCPHHFSICHMKACQAMLIYHHDSKWVKLWFCKHLS